MTLGQMENALLNAGYEVEKAGISKMQTLRQANPGEAVSTSLTRIRATQHVGANTSSLLQYSDGLNRNEIRLDADPPYIGMAHRYPEKREVDHPRASSADSWRNTRMAGRCRSHRLRSRSFYRCAPMTCA